MVIPQGVNQLQFLWEANRMGVRITSRYKYVYTMQNGVGVSGMRKGRHPLWTAVYGRKGDKNYFRKTFPFSEKGEVDAYLAVLQYLEQNNIKHE